MSTQLIVIILISITGFALSQNPIALGELSSLTYTDTCSPENSVSEDFLQLSYNQTTIQFPLFELNEAESTRIFDKFDSNTIDNIRSSQASASLKAQMGDAKFQGCRGTCNTFATIALFEFYHQGKRFSEQCLAKLSAPTDKSWPEIRIRFATANGLYCEENCRYFPSSLTVISKENGPKTVCDINQIDRNKIPNLSEFTPFMPNDKFVFESSEIAGPIEHIKQKIDNGHPVIINVFVAGPGWDQWNGSNKIISLPTEEEIGKMCPKPAALSSKVNCALHSIVITGYDNANSCFEFKNSWGKDYADGGYGRMSYAYFLKMRKGLMISK